MPDRDQRFNQEEQPNQPAIPVVNAATPTTPKQPQLQKRKLHLFSEFCEEPEEVTFHDQEEGEQILLFLRKSQIANLHWIFMSIILLLLPLSLIFLPAHALPFAIPFGLSLVVLLLYYLVAITYIFVNYIIWYYNAALITTERIVDIDFHQLIYKDIAETKLGLVQDVSYRQQSVVESLFDFGYVLVQTAGTIDNFEFDSLPHPERIEEIVNSLIGKGRVYVP